MNLKHPFVMDLSSLDPKFNHDGLPFGPWQFDNISKECYLISKSINTSYTDVLKISPTERGKILGWLAEEAVQKKQQLEAISAKMSK